MTKCSVPNSAPALHLWLQQHSGSRARAGLWLLKRSSGEGYSNPAIPSSPQFLCSWRTCFSPHCQKHSVNCRCLGCFWVTQFSAGIKTDATERPGNRITHRMPFLLFSLPRKKRDYLNVWKTIAGMRRAAQS